MNASHVDQFYTSGCVGFSGTNALNTTHAVRSRIKFNQTIPNGRAGRTYLDNNDGLRNYSESTKRDQFKTWTYPPTDQGSSAIGLMKWWREIGVTTGYDWTFTFTGFLAALQNQPVLIGSSWYEGLNHPDEKGIARVSGNNIGGHEYLANAILWNARLIGCEQSWGENWGKKGTFYIPWDDMEHLIMDDGDVAVPRFL